VDPGTMSPYQHGEVFVTDDGAETDLDLGHYERFVSTPVSQRNSFSAGRVYRNVIERERRGEYLGRTVQVIPHITDEIKRLIHEVAAEADVAIVEVGGTVGDIESTPFLEAIRQFRRDAGAENVLYIHVTLVPHVRTAGELKTKPTQHSVKELREIGIQPDILLCRCDRDLPKDLRDKLALFCDVARDDVIAAPDVETIYELPLVFHRQDLDDRISSRLGMWLPAARLEKWEALVAGIRGANRKVRIGVVGKYVHLADTYKSLNEALMHGAVAHDARLELVHLDSEKIDPLNPGALLAGCDGVLVPGGFGERGVEGKVAAIRFARENKVPFFGICLGMQLAVVEFSRSVLGWRDAQSLEFSDHSQHLVVRLMDAQREVTDKGGTMRLGAWPCQLREGSRVARIYGDTVISERHRHRYEVDPSIFTALEAGGLAVVGRSPDGRLAELIELADHPYFVACQFHPEFKSRPLAPHPLFRAFVGAALDYGSPLATVPLNP
jgi:CTP synthase